MKQAAVQHGSSLSAGQAGVGVWRHTKRCKSGGLASRCHAAAHTNDVSGPGPTTPNKGYARLRQATQRKQMQQQQQQQFAEDVQQAASKRQDGKLQFELTDTSPRFKAEQAQERHRAEFNFSLQQRIESCTHWQQLAGLIEGLHHDQEGGRGRDLVNYISVARLCGRLGVLAGPGESKEGGTQEQERYAWLRGELAALVGEHASWFYSQHLAQAATGLAAAGHADPQFWASLEAISERRLLSFSGPQLAQIMVALATSGHIPSLNWLQRSEIQASKHWNDISPGGMAGMLWAWGRVNYTPSRGVIEVMKQRLKGMMSRQQLKAQQLLQVLYGMARLTRDHPREAWLHTWCEEFQPFMGQVSPPTLADALFCLASLQFTPRPMWLAAALSQVSRGLTGELGSRNATSSSRNSSASSASTNSRNTSSSSSSSSSHSPAFSEGVDESSSRNSSRSAASAAKSDPVSQQSQSTHAQQGAQLDAEAATSALPAKDTDQQQNGFSPAGIESGDDPALMGRILRQPGPEFRSLQDMVGSAEDDGAAEMWGSEFGEADADGDEGESFLEEEDSFDWGEASESKEEEAFLLGDGQGEDEGEEDSFLMSEEAGDDVGSSDEQQQSLVSPSTGPVHQGGVLAPPSGDFFASEDGGSAAEQAEQQAFEEQGGRGGGNEAPEWVSMGASASYDPFIHDQHQGAQQQQQQQQQEGDSNSQGQQQPQPNPPPHTLLVPSLAACCPLIGPQPFLQQQAQLAHHPLDAPCTAQLAWSLSVMACVPQPRWVEAYTSHARALLPTMDAPALADTLYGLSSLNITHNPALLTAASQRMLELVGGHTAAAVEPEALVLVLVALARCGHRPSPDWLQTMEHASGEVMHKLSGWRMADLIAALATFQHRPSQEWLDSFESCSLPLLPSCPSQQLARLCWALAVMQHRPPTPWLHELLVFTRARMRAMSDSDFACVAWSFARLRHRPGTLWLEEYSDEARRRLPQLPPQQVADIAWALAAFAHLPTPEWMETLEVIIITRGSAFKPQQMAVLLWACQQFKHLPLSPDAFVAAAHACLEADSSRPQRPL